MSKQRQLSDLSDIDKAEQAAQRLHKDEQSPTPDRSCSATTGCGLASTLISPFRTPAVVAEYLALYDPDFGDKVTHAYQLKCAADSFCQQLRRKKYGTPLACQYRRGHTPIHIRAEWQERMKTPEEVLASDTEDDESASSGSDKPLNECPCVNCTAKSSDVRRNSAAQLPEASAPGEETGERAEDDGPQEELSRP